MREWWSDDSMEIEYIAGEQHFKKKESKAEDVE